MDNRVRNRLQKHLRIPVLAILLAVTGFSRGLAQEGTDTGPDSMKEMMSDTLRHKSDSLALEKISKAVKDSLKTEQRRRKPSRMEKYGLESHSPRKATLYSAILPGLGQIYNRRYVRASLVYAGLATFIYFIDYNDDLYQQYKQAYIDITDDDPTSTSYEDLNIDGQWDFTNSSHVTQFTTRLERAKDSSRRYRDLCIIGTAAFYALNIIEATVDAHFFDFDISDDLSFNWMPQPVRYMDQTLVGFQCVIRF